MRHPVVILMLGEKALPEKRIRGLDSSFTLLTLVTNLAAPVSRSATSLKWSSVILSEALPGMKLLGSTAA